MESSSSSNNNSNQTLLYLTLVRNDNSGWVVLIDKTGLVASMDAVRSR